MLASSDEGVRSPPLLTPPPIPPPAAAADGGGGGGAAIVTSVVDMVSDEQLPATLSQRLRSAAAEASEVPCWPVLQLGPRGSHTMRERRERVPSGNTCCSWPTCRKRGDEVMPHTSRYSPCASVSSCITARSHRRRTCCSKHECAPT